MYEEIAKSFSGLAGESRSHDANGPWFKVQGSGGAETLNLGNGLFGSAIAPIVGINPAPDKTRPPLQPDVPCETQQPPDLGSIPAGPPAAVDTSGVPLPREKKATATAVAIERRQLKSAGSRTKVSDRLATLADLRKIADLKGVGAQLEKTLTQSERRP